MTQKRRHARFGSFFESSLRGLSYLVVLVLGAATGFLSLAYLLAGEVYDYQDTFDGGHLPPVDAIVCLAGGRGRISAAGDLWYRYWEASHSAAPGIRSKPVVPRVPVLYLSGLGSQMSWPLFLPHLRRGVRQEITADQVVLETVSTTTEENALWLLKHARERHWKRLLLVTSSYHMKRARYLIQRVFRSQGQSLELETFSVIQDPFDPLEWRTSGLQGTRVTVAEYLKYLYATMFWAPRKP